MFRAIFHGRRGYGSFGVERRIRVYHVYFLVAIYPHLLWWLFEADFISVISFLCPTRSMFDVSVIWLFRNE